MAKEIKKRTGNQGQYQTHSELDSFGRNFDTTIDGSPVVQEMQINNADYSLATSVDLNEIGRGSTDEASLINTIASGTQIKITALDSPSRNVIFNATGAPTTGSIPVTHVDSGGDGNFLDNEGVNITIYKGGGNGSVFIDDVFRIQDDGDDTKEIAFQASAITTATTRTVTMPDTDVDLGDIALNNTHRSSDGSDHSFIDQDVTSGSSPVFNGVNITGLTKIIFSDYIVGSTDGPTTVETTSGDADIIAEMTKTFTPESATNKIEINFGSSFNNSGDQTAIAGIFIDGVLEAETETREYANAGVFPGSINIFWQGTHATSEMIITVRMWTTGGTLTATGVLRNMLVKEIRE